MSDKLAIQSQFRQLFQRCPEMAPPMPLNNASIRARLWVYELAVIKWLQDVLNAPCDQRLHVVVDICTWIENVLDKRTRPEDLIAVANRILDTCKGNPACPPTPSEPATKS